MKLTSPGQLHIVTNIYNRDTLACTQSLPPSRWVILSRALELARTAGETAKTLFKYIIITPGFVVVFIFKEKINADLLFLCPKGGGGGSIFPPFLKLAVTNGINCPRT